MRTYDIDKYDNYNTRLYTLVKEKELLEDSFFGHSRAKAHVGQKSKAVAKRRKRNKNKKTHR